ncbi:MAG: hypothetical protein H6845_00230 [Alphaproteobacteria bacterium]|nr:MAG: hypothetical protein H6845_00230 [Alphaproteobacteria bacterium]
MKLKGNLANFKCTFGDYDIRGVVGDSFSVEYAYLIGKAFGSTIQCKHAKTVAVGYDRRQSSVDFQKAYIQGLLDSGANVIDLGRVSTAYTSLSYRFINADAATMITASHNPPKYNGFKFYLRGNNFFGDSLIELYDRISSGSFFEGEGSYSKASFMNEYVHFLFKNLNVSRNKAIWDAGHGIAGDILPHIAKFLPTDHIFYRTEVSNNVDCFDNTKSEFLQQTCAFLKKHPGYIAFSFDGDADRMVVTDESGNVWTGDEIIFLFSSFIAFERNRQICSVWDSKSSKTLIKYAEQLGVKSILSKTGHCYVVDAIKKNNAAFGGEISGHYMFNDKFFCVDDGIYAALRILDVLEYSSYTLAQMKELIPEVWTSKLFRINCNNLDKYEVMGHIKDSLIRDNKMVELIHDSLVINHPNGWWLVRPSQTENAISARCEGWTQSSYEEVRDFMEAIITSCGLSL